MGERFISGVFIPIVRAGLGLPVDEAPVVSESDVPLLLDTASKQSVLPVIQEGLSALNIRGRAFDAVQELCMNDMFLYAQRDIALENICGCFEESGIRYILLKGSVLRDLYPSPWMRTSCDIDILIDEANVDKAIGILEEKTEFRLADRLFHDVTLRSTDVQLELHFSLTERMESIDGLLSRAWDYALPENGTMRYVFTPEFQIFHVVAHMSYHFIHKGLGIRAYLDLWLLRHKTRFDENKVREMCSDSGILKYYDESCRLSEVWLGDGEHTETTKALERFSFDGGALGSDKTASLSLRREKGGIRYFFARLFVKRENLEILYPRLKKYPFLMPYYQVKKWISALLFRRKKIKRELSIYLGTDKNDVESLERLFKSVGLGESDK